MKVLLLTPHYPPEIRSVSRLMAELAEDLYAAGHTVTVVAPLPPKESAGPVEVRGLPRQEITAGIRVVRVRTMPFVSVAPWLRAVTHFTLAGSLALGALSAGRHDVIIAYSPPLTIGLSCDLLRRVWEAPFVLNVQDIYPQTLIDLGLARQRFVVWLLLRIEQYAYRRAGVITVHSEGNRRLLLRRGLDPAKVRVVPNWVDTSAIRPAPRTNGLRATLGLRDEFVALFAGILGYAQDVDVILEAARLLQAHPEIVFVLAGDGVRKAQAVRQVEAWQLRNVRLLPFQPLEQYPALVTMADVCLVTLQKSVTTPVVPSKIMTIMAAGRPVVATVSPGGDAYEVIAGSGGGVCTPPGDARALAEAILALYRDPVMRMRTGEAGRRFAVAHFDRRAVTSVYAHLLAGLRPPHQVGDVSSDAPLGRGGRHVDHES